MKKTKKLTALLLAFVLVFSFALLPVSAEEGNAQVTATLNKDLFKTNYPYVFVHGMGGWADYNGEAYWGGWAESEGDVIKLYNDNGIEAYAAVVGPLSSAWDRACELYAQLTGTVVDYGEAHSKAHGHDRFGYDYSGKELMGKAWDLKSPVNVVGHSFGGPTVRLFASLLAYGDEAEIAATGEDTSPFFTGGHKEAIHSVITFSGVHNGSPIANLIVDNGLLYLIGAALHLAGVFVGRNLMMWDLQLGHFGITPVQGEERAKFSLKTILNFVKAKDNCGYDMTLRGAAELNEKIKLVDSAYYYSYSCISSEETKCGTQIPIASNFQMFIPTSIYIGALEGRTIDGVYMDKNWAINDGIVPLASALYPTDDAETAKNYDSAIEKGETVEPGRWYYMTPMVGFDHFDFCGTIDYLTSFEDFYFTLLETVNAR